MVSPRVHTRPLVVIFAKVPIPGGVKTRLIPFLGAERAAGLHRAFTADLLARLRSGFDLELHTDCLTDAWTGAMVSNRRQGSGDLGARMHLALSEGLGRGYPGVVILGADAPHLPLSHIATLQASQSDVTLGPAEDGGFWGISCRRVHEEMFRGVEWSSGSTLSQTVTACRATGLTVALGPEWWDVDTPADLVRLAGFGLHEGPALEFLRSLAPGGDQSAFE